MLIEVERKPKPAPTQFLIIFRLLLINVSFTASIKPHLHGIDNPGVFFYRTGLSI